MLHFKKGELLFFEGDKSNFVYRLVSGEAVISRFVPDGCEVTGRIAAGDFIGELGVLISCRRSGTARFLADSSVESFTRDEFIALILKTPDLSGRLLHVLSLRTRSQVEILQQLPDRETIRRLRRRRPILWISYAAWRLLQPVNDRLRYQLKSYRSAKNIPDLLPIEGFPTKSFKKNSRLFEEGQRSENVFWVASGHVDILKKVRGSERKVGYVRRHEFVGEMGVLESMPRNFSASAGSDLVVRVVSPSDFFLLMQQSPAAYRIVMDSLCERARRLRKILRHIHAIENKLPAAREGIFEVAGSIESVGQLAEQRMVEETLKMRRFLHVQVEHGRFIKSVYQSYLKGTATEEEMEKANSYFRDYLKMAGLGTLFLLPGALLTLPLVVKVGKALGIDILPSAEEEGRDEGDSDVA